MITALGISALQLTGAGFCMGIGFWLSKKLTNKMDEKFLLYDKRALKELGMEYA